ncbi:MAG: DUF1289 domain-containing protein, partial [Verrucomicrobiota bacterium]
MNPLHPAKSVESPCIAICRMDEADRVCLGCGRTRAQIAGWQEMTATEKTRVLAGLRADALLNQPGNLLGQRLDL